MRELRRIREQSDTLREQIATGDCGVEPEEDKVPQPFQNLIALIMRGFRLKKVSHRFDSFNLSAS